MSPAHVPIRGPGELWIWRAPRVSAQGVHPKDQQRLPPLDRVLSLLPESAARLALRGRAYRQAGLRFESAPTPDFGTPSEQQMERSLQGVQSALDRGERVLVHCMAGLGRAGTLCACLLVRQGVAPDQAMATVRAVRPGAIEVAAQEALVRRWAALAGA